MEFTAVESEVEFAGGVEEHDFVVGIEKQVNVFTGVTTSSIGFSDAVVHYESLVGVVEIARHSHVHLSSIQAFIPMSLPRVSLHGISPKTLKLISKPKIYSDSNNISVFHRLLNLYVLVAKDLDLLSIIPETRVETV